MPQNQIEDSDVDLALFNHIVETFSDGPYWHQRIKSVLAAAGFATRRIEREEAHPSVWQASLTRTTFDLAIDNDTAIKQLRKILKDGGIKIARDEFSIIARRGDNLECGFFLDLGAPGVA